MAFLTPALLLLGFLAIPIIALYMLRLRRREIIVSSTMLWQKLIQDREANAPWQRLRRNLLLFLQLMILAFLVLALARPFLPVSSIVSGNMVILLDASGSMLAKDVSPNRFSAGKEQVVKLINDLGAGDQMTLILVGHMPEVLAPATGEKSELRLALDAAQAAPQGVDWPSALALAAGAAQGYSDARIVIISDGGLPEDLPPLPAELVYLPIGTSGDNLAISALATQATVTGAQLFTSVSNYGLHDRQTLLSVFVDGALFDSRLITIPGEGANDFTWDIPEEPSIIEARLSENVDDNLEQDDTAWTVHMSGLGNRVLLVTEGNRFLETVLDILPNVKVFRASPDAILAEQEDDSFDLQVIDGLPLALPPATGDLLIINPQPSSQELVTDSSALFSVTGVFTNTEVVSLADNPLLKYVDWSNVNVRKANRVDAPWAEPLVMANGGPLLLAGERDGRRSVIITFGLQDSDLPLQIAFPVLIANIMSWLHPNRIIDGPIQIPSGDPVIILPATGAEVVTVTKPDGLLWMAEVAEEETVFADTEQLGVYEVRFQDDDGDQLAGRFAVNMMTPSESAIKPAKVVDIGQTSLEISGNDDIGQRQLWPWLTAIAISILLIEWWIYHRGVGFPRLFSGRQS